MSRPLPPVAQAASSTPVRREELPLVGPEPQRFVVAEGQLANVASAAWTALMRLGSGGFVSGYSVSLVPDDGKYGVLTLAGRKVRETGDVGTFKRPSQPIVIYEFEGVGRGVGVDGWEGGGTGGEMTAVCRRCGCTASETPPSTCPLALPPLPPLQGAGGGQLPRPRRALPALPQGVCVCGGGGGVMGQVGG